MISSSSASLTVSYDSDVTGNTVQVSGGAIEVVGIIASAGGAALAVSFYDVNNGAADPNKKRAFIAANAGESTPFTPRKNMLFTRGLYMVFEQGGSGQGGGEVTLLLDR